jgi:hypothetical protein
MDDHVKSVENQVLREYRIFGLLDIVLQKNKQNQTRLYAEIKATSKSANKQMKTSRLLTSMILFSD